MKSVESAKVSSTSQITVPRKVRELLRIGQGDRIGFEATADGRFIIGKATTAHKSDGAAAAARKGSAGAGGNRGSPDKCGDGG